MNLEEQIQACRARASDLKDPPLWSDEEWTLFLNEAQNEAAERGQLLLDMTTPEVCVIDVTAGQQTYAVHASILKIKRAKMDLGDRPLIETSVEDLDSGGTGWFPSGLNASGSNATWYPGGSDWEKLTGEPERFFQNADNSITLVRIPVRDDTLRLRVTRLPLAPMVNDDDEPEIAARYHYRMLDWALRCAYLKQDPDTLDEKKAEKFEASFIAAFGVRPDANVQRKRRDRRPAGVRMGMW